jgi:hypothetical protein
VFYVWDECAGYYYMSTRNVGAPNGAVGQLVWESIQDVVGRGVTFDFNGIATEGDMRFMAGFG